MGLTSPATVCGSYESSHSLWVLRVQPQSVGLTSLATVCGSYKSSHSLWVLRVQPQSVGLTSPATVCGSYESSHSLRVLRVQPQSAGLTSPATVCGSSIINSENSTVNRRKCSKSTSCVSQNNFKMVSRICPSMLQEENKNIFPRINFLDDQINLKQYLIVSNLVWYNSLPTATLSVGCQ